MSKPKRIVTTSVVAVLLLLALAVVGLQWDPSASLRGRFDAFREVQHGHYKLLVYGLPTRWRPDGAALVHERHPEATVVAVAGCIVTPRLVHYVRAYDGYMEKASVRRFGRNIFDDAFADAQAAYDRKHPPVATAN